MTKKDCPICEFPIKKCQCKYTGTAHPSRYIQAKVVKDHLYLLSRKQLKHVISLEAYWRTSSLDDKYMKHLGKLERQSN